MNLAAKIKGLEKKYAEKAKESRVQAVEWVKRILTRNEIKKIVMECLKDGVFKYSISFTVFRRGDINIRLYNGRQGFHGTCGKEDNTEFFHLILDTISGVITSHGFKVIDNTQYAGYRECAGAWIGEVIFTTDKEEKQ